MGAGNRTSTISAGTSVMTPFPGTATVQESVQCRWVTGTRPEPPLTFHYALTGNHSSPSPQTRLFTPLSSSARSLSPPECSADPGTWSALVKNHSGPRSWFVFCHQSFQTRDYPRLFPQTFLHTVSQIS